MGALAAAALVVSTGCGPAGEWTEPLTGMEFVLVRRGEFAMGSPPSEAGREDRENQHRVAISRDFYLGRTEVTQGQWQQVMGSKPSHFGACGADCPVESVNWLEVRLFITRLNDLTGASFRLPTEAEWEYACRAGTATPFHTGESLTADQANFAAHFPYPGSPAGVFRERPVPVRSFAPNAWGLYDMHGNVWEWCEDDDCAYDSGPVTDPLGRCPSGRKVIRGGSWYFDANSARCALRYTHAPGDRGFSLGLRLARSIPTPLPNRARSERD